MRINDIFESSTSSGSIAVVATPLGGIRARAAVVGKGVYPSKGKVGGNLLTGKASKKKYANSVGVNESVTLKFHTVDLRPDQFHWYTKNYYDEYNIESHYGNFLHNLKALAHQGHKINESKEFDAVQPFIDAVNRVGTKKTIKIDDMFAVLTFEIIYLDELINVRGFTVPKKITQIKKHPDGTINYIRFDDGTRYPRISKATAGNRQFEYAAYFDSETDADHALTILGLMIPNNWEVSTADLNKQWPMYGLKEDNMKIAEMFNGVVTEEASRLEEDDFILVPGKGNKLKTGLHSFDPDKAEHEGETLKNSLRTIARVASELNKRLDDQDNFPEWVSEKVGAIKSMMTGVMQYLASEQAADHAELGEFGAGVIAGGGVGEGQRHNTRLVPNRPDHEISMAKGEMRSAFNSAKNIYKMLDSRSELMAWQQSYITLASDYLDSVADSMKEEEQTHGSSVAEGAKVDRMVKHIKSSEKKSGKSDKDAESIAWATLNKRGMLDNANKKKGK